MAVYLPQEVMYKNNKGELVPKFSTYPAARYGDVITLLPYGNVMLSPQPMIYRLRTALQHYSDEDFILPIGDPAAIGACMAIAANNNNGRIQLLRWDRRAHKYHVSKMNVHGGSYD